MIERFMLCKVEIQKDEIGLFWTVFDSELQGHIEIKFLEKEQAIAVALDLLQRELSSASQ
jgi:hypothetical protein